MLPLYGWNYCWYATTGKGITLKVTAFDSNSKKNERVSATKNCKQGQQGLLGEEL